jgi:hypothetical protein
MQHGPVPPSHQPHHRVVVVASHAHEVRGGVAELVDVDRSDPGLQGSASHGSRSRWASPGPSGTHADGGRLRCKPPCPGCLVLGFQVAPERRDEIQYAR